MAKERQADERTRLLRRLQSEVVRLREALAQVQERTRGVVEVEAQRPLTAAKRRCAAILRR